MKFTLWRRKGEEEGFSQGDTETQRKSASPPLHPGTSLGPPETLRVSLGKGDLTSDRAAFRPNGAFSKLLSVLAAQSARTPVPVLNQLLGRMGGSNLRAKRAAFWERRRGYRWRRKQGSHAL